jgi:hypothetical protein
MQLRNGKKILVSVPAPVSAPANEMSFVDMTREALSRHGQMYEPATYYEKLNSLLAVFNVLNDQSAETLSGMDDDYKFLATIYRKTVELMCVIVNRSYTTEYTDDEKIAIIRLLSLTYQVRYTVSDILWEVRTHHQIQEMMEHGDRHSDLLYRCLKHMVSEESESDIYEVYKYEDGEYTDVELYDWYLLPNYDENIRADTYNEYIENADDCFGGEISRYNRRLWS